MCTTTPPQPAIVDSPVAVCAFKYLNGGFDQYEMITYATEHAARADGAFITHNRACGLCSSAQDLAAYLQYTDMVTHGRRCAILANISKKLGLKCYLELGYSVPCATIWNYDGISDRQSCA